MRKTSFWITEKQENNAILLSSRIIVGLTIIKEETGIINQRLFIKDTAELFLICLLIMIVCSRYLMMSISNNIYDA